MLVGWQGVGERKRDRERQGVGIEIKRQNRGNFILYYVLWIGQHILLLRPLKNLYLVVIYVQFQLKSEGSVNRIFIPKYSLLNAQWGNYGGSYTYENIVEEKAKVKLNKNQDIRSRGSMMKGGDGSRTLFSSESLCRILY